MYGKGEGSESLVEVDVEVKEGVEEDAAFVPDPDPAAAVVDFGFVAVEDATCCVMRATRTRAESSEVSK